MNVTENDYSQHASGGGQTGGVAQSDTGPAVAGQAAAASEGSTAASGNAAAASDSGAAAAGNSVSANRGATASQTSRLERVKASRLSQVSGAVCVVALLAAVILLVVGVIPMSIAGFAVAFVAALLAAIPLLG